MNIQVFLISLKEKIRSDCISPFFFYTYLDEKFLLLQSLKYVPT